MTADGFRRIALAMKDVTESAHHGHPDFRVGGRIFASVGYPDAAWGMVILTPEDQAEWVRSHPAAFAPVKGKWGEGGSTNVRLAAVDEETLGEVLTLARQLAEAKQSARRPARRRRTS